MSMNLIHTNRNVDQGARAKADWAALTAIGEHAMVFIDEDVVDSIARVLDGQVLTNGQTVSAYPRDEDADPEFAPESYVASFGASLLPVQVQDQIRDRLARGETGKDAVRLFNEILKRDLQVSFSGKDHCAAHIKGVNWRADEVEINRCTGNMHAMLRDLGLGRFVSPHAEAGMGEVDFDTFAKAVNDNGGNTDSGERLRAFVACARRQDATHVYWA